MRQAERPASPADSMSAQSFKRKGNFAMTTKTRKKLRSPAELKLADITGFNGKYLDSLLAKAAQVLKIDLPNVASYLREVKRREAALAKEKWGLSLRKHQDLQQKGKQILRSFSSGYSMGDRKTLVINGNTFCSLSSCQTHAKSCKWAPLHGEVTIRLSMKQLKSLELIEGVWTIRGKDNACSWLACEGFQRKFRVVIAEGFLVGTSHGKLLAECEASEAVKAEKLREAAKSLFRFVGIIDRLSAGACEPGVLSFCSRHGLDPSMGYRLDYLFGLNDPVARPYLDRLARLTRK